MAGGANWFTKAGTIVAITGPDRNQESKEFIQEFGTDLQLGV